MERRLNTSRTNFLSITVYFAYLLTCICNKKTVNYYMDRNDADVISRYSVDYDPTLKSALTRNRKHLKGVGEKD
jgi:hypothetical protein